MKIVTKKTKLILQTASVLLGIVYFIAAFSKAIEIKIFYQTIAEFGFSQFSFLAPVIVVFEMALAMALILQIRTKQAALISLITIVTFTLLYSYAHIFKSVEKCDCFGSIGNDWAPAWFYVRNAIMFCMSIFIYLIYPKETEINSYKIQIAFFVLLTVSYMTGYSYNSPGKISKPEKKLITFEGKNIRNTPLYKYAPASNDSVYLIFLFSYSCPHCLNSIENLKQYATSNYVKNIILIGTGEDSARVKFYNNFDVRFPHYDVSKETMKQLTNMYPTCYFIVNDTIKKSLVGTLPAHQNLRKMRFLEL
jgi:uncharacterized membrane protein YphA (DoxX/SURF4 family)